MAGLGVPQMALEILRLAAQTGKAKTGHLPGLGMQTWKTWTYYWHIGCGSNKGTYSTPPALGKFGKMKTPPNKNSYPAWGGAFRFDPAICVETTQRPGRRSSSHTGSIPRPPGNGSVVEGFIRFGRFGLEGASAPADTNKTFRYPKNFSRNNIPYHYSTTIEEWKNKSFGQLKKISAAHQGTQSSCGLC